MPKAPATASAHSAVAAASAAPASATASKPAVAGAKASGQPVPDTYEAALQELEQLVGHIDSGQLPLEQLLSGYQRGAELLQFCRDRLAAVEEQIKVLDGPILKPWNPA